MAYQAYPGYLIKEKSSDTKSVKLIQQALRDFGYGIHKTGVFDKNMTAVVKLFQAQRSDENGFPLAVDGKVGSHTWVAMFGPPPKPLGATITSSPLMLQALSTARTQIGQMEQPIGANRGPMVDQYLKSVGLSLKGANPDSRAWCMAFIYWTFAEACRALARATPLPKTGGVLTHWRETQKNKAVRRISAHAAYANPALVQPGFIFILDFGSGLGHTGLVDRILPDGRLVTVEGNTNKDGSRTGVGVFELDRRKLNDKTLVGFVDYTNA
ncbi:peptidoglycan-binding protein [Massilia sp. DD77]|uniref:peptidoglycan-binding protein n=1 Tax=Massilia sp. DD77 TaxID=3109349 RepID=UPI002FFD708F